MAKITSRYKPDHDSMALFLLSRRVEDVAMEAADDIAKVAAADAARHSRSGNLARGFKTRPGIGGLKMEGGPRRTAWVVNEERNAAAVELGSKRNPARHHLLKAGMKWHTPRRRRG